MKLQCVKTWFAIAALMLLATLQAMAQTNSATRGGLGGVVYDQAGALVPGATSDNFRASGPVHLEDRFLGTL